MKKRLLACVLVLSLLLNLSVSAFASGYWYTSDDEGYLPPSELPPLSEIVPFDDIKVNPEDYILNSGISTGSLGLTLSIGQIAALIAAGAGCVYATQYIDDLGTHLDSALTAASDLVDGGRAAYMSWLASAVNGDIKLASAPPWIAKTILDVVYGMVTNIAPLVGGYDFGGVAPSVSGEVLSAGSRFYYGKPRILSTGAVVRPYYVFSADVIPVVFYNDWTMIAGFVHTKPNTVGQYEYYDDLGNLSSSGAVTGFKWSSVNDDNLNSYRYFILDVWSLSGGITQEILDVFNTYCLPGAIYHDFVGGVPGYGSFSPYFEKLVNGLPIDDGIIGMPEGGEVAPDVLVGGLPEVWVGQGLGADVITFPDIMIDGTGVLAPDTTLEGEAAWDVAIDGTLEDLKTGELSWSDYWLDISNSVPVAKVEDETTGDIVDRPIGDDGSLKDPVLVPEYSTDPNEYSIDLKRFFPFCIPFDLYNFFCCLASDPETPVFNLSIPFLGYSYDFTVDLTPFNDMAALVRSLELFLFIIVLATTTRDNMIKG